MVNTNVAQYFNSTHFVASFVSLKQLPTHQCHEVVFAGRSNCGKSSVINAITGKNKLAITSKTPGRTRAINYFQIQDNQYLIDLPGYGYAKVPAATKQQWQKLLDKFFQTRTSLSGVVLIMDIRHPLTNFDQQMLDFCHHHALPLHVVLNKSDKLSKQQIISTEQQVSSVLKQFSTEISLQSCSAAKKTGVAELQQKVISWLANAQQTD